MIASAMLAGRGMVRTLSLAEPISKIAVENL